MKMQFMKDHTCPKEACGCIINELPTKLLVNLLFDLIPENFVQIWNWLLQHVGSSAYNFCQTQNLPLINSSLPLKLLIDLNAKLVAVHRVSPMLVHLIAKVKADFDKDPALGVRDTVP